MPMRWLSVATDWLFESGRRAFLVCLLAGLAVSWLSVDYSRLRHGSSSMKPVSLLLQHPNGAGINFAIPLAYLPASEDRRGGDSGGLIIVRATYPEMSPIDRRRDGYASTELREISIRPLQFDPEIWIRSSESDSVRAILAGNAGQDSMAPEAGMPGFLVYRFKWAGKINEYLVPTDRAGAEAHATFVDCGPYLDADLARPINGICSAYVQHSDRTFIVYSIPRRALDQWQDMEEKVLTLTNSFVVSCFEGSPLEPDEQPQNTHSCDMK
jgi:hypothetical protein